MAGKDSCTDEIWKFGFFIITKENFGSYSFFSLGQFISTLTRVSSSFWTRNCCTRMFPMWSQPETSFLDVWWDGRTECVRSYACLSVSAHLHTAIVWGCWWALIHFNNIVRDCIMFCFTKYENYLQLWRNNPHNSSESLPLLLMRYPPYLLSTLCSVCAPRMQKDLMTDAAKQGCHSHSGQ